MVMKQTATKKARPVTKKQTATKKKTAIRTTTKTTTVSFLLDRSGSMQSVKSDVIGGFNQFIADQKKQPGKCKFVFTLFDGDSIDMPLFDVTKKHPDIADVPELTDHTYAPRSMTPLLDAIGKTIKATEDLNPKGRVLFVIYTDGLENASHEYTRSAVSKLVKEKEEAGWDFIFLGADIDAYSEATSLGIGGQSTFGHAGPQGAPGSVGVSFNSLSQATADYRGGAVYSAATSSLREVEKKQGKSRPKEKK